MIKTKNGIVKTDGCEAVVMADLATIVRHVKSLLLEHYSSDETDLRIKTAIDIGNMSVEELEETTSKGLEG